MLYQKFKEELAIKIKENGSVFTWETHKYEVTDNILWLVENRKYAIFSVFLERSRFLVRIKSVRLEPLADVGVKPDWDMGRYIVVCKYNQLGSSLGAIKTQLDQLKQQRQSLMNAESECQNELNKLIKEMGKYVD